ncbi:hypothetical protein FPV67DRAFT_1483150 [Lyophyllum atratum]|nr:hypothetical protein FPV67DRAFT_1483150 [Lyophyllum atratum]
MSRLELAKIPALTFYKDHLTTARRTSPIPQLVCKGAPCKLYQPEVVRCVSLPGGYGTEVDWKCEADLPEALRFGRVEVGCEGWSKPGDPYVLKGSCSLEYRLVQVPGVLRDTNESPIKKLQSYDLSAIIFSVIWVAFLVFILYNFFLSCFRRNSAARATQAPRPPAGPRPGTPGGWFPGGMDDNQENQPPPPPYSKNANTGEPARQGWRPGFWTGAAIGGALNHLYNRNQAQPQPQPQPRRSVWDWERPQSRPSIFGGRPAARTSGSDDRGEGSSNLGSMRRSTGLGGSNVR